jgi:hypothetical protein
MDFKKAEQAERERIAKEKAAPVLTEKEIRQAKMKIFDDENN